MQILGLAMNVSDRGIPWRSTSSPGVFWLLLSSEPDSGPKAERGATVLIRMDPGCGYPAHEHLDVEEVLVLAGGYRDEIGEYPTGEYVRYEAGSRHTPVALGDPSQPIGPDNPSCLLYASARGGTRPLHQG